MLFNLLARLTPLNIVTTSDEQVVPSNALLNDDGSPIVNDDGSYILTDD